MKTVQRALTVAATLITALAVSLTGPTTANAQMSSGLSSGLLPSPGQSPAQQPTAPATLPQEDPTRTLNINLGPATNQGIYHDSTSWNYLSRPGEVVPGGSIVSEHGFVCSAGWIISKGGQMYVTTAAHCGDVGTDFGIINSQGYLVVFGEVTERAYNRTTGTDRALIRVDNPAMVNPDIPVHNFRYARKMSPAEVAQTRPTICVLGQTSGLSCGPYYSVDYFGRINFSAIATHGDSGGPVFALVNSSLYPVGVLQGGYENTNILAAQSLEGPMFAGATLVQ